MCIHIEFQLVSAPEIGVIFLKNLAQIGVGTRLLWDGPFGDDITSQSIPEQPEKFTRDFVNLSAGVGIENFLVDELIFYEINRQKWFQSRKIFCFRVILSSNYAFRFEIF